MLAETRPVLARVSLAMIALALQGCSAHDHVMDCWLLPEAERAAAPHDGRCGDAFARYYKPLPQIVTEMATGFGGKPPAASDAGGRAAGGGAAGGKAPASDRRRR